MPHDLAASPLPWREWRRRRGYTQAVLGERAGVDTSTIAHLESGTRAPGVAVLLRVCDSLGLEAEERVTAMRAAAAVSEARSCRADTGAA